MGQSLQGATFSPGVFAAGLRDLGGYSGGGHTEEAMQMDRYNRQQRAAQGLSAALQNGTDPSQAFLAYTQAGGDPATADAILGLQDKLAKQKAMTALGNYFSGSPQTPQGGPQTPQGGIPTPQGQPGAAPMMPPNTGIAGPQGMPPSMMPPGAAQGMPGAPGAPGGQFDPQAIIRLLAQADPAQAASLAFQNRNYQDTKSRQDYQDVTTAEDSVNQAIRNSRLDAERAKENSPEFQGRRAGAIAEAELPFKLKEEAARNTAAGNVQSVQQIQLPGGSAGLLTVYRNGKREVTTVDGQPVVSSMHDPGSLYDQSAAKAGGTAAGTTAANFPAVQGAYEMMKHSIAGLNSPEVKAESGNALGLIGSNLPKIPGVNSDFLNRAEQVKGQAFLQAYNTLKGGGAITDIEGEKATTAIARLQRAQTKTEFYQSLQDAETEIDKLYRLAQDRAKRGATTPQMQTPGMSAGTGAPHVMKYNPATGKLE